MAKQMHTGRTSNEVRPIMMRSAPLIFLATAGFVLAQQPASNSNGGWRRVGDPPPTATPAPAPAASAPGNNPAPANNPEPVARDQYGQAANQTAPETAPDAAAGDQDVVSAPAPPPEPQEPVQARQQPQAGPPRSTRPAYGLPREVTLKSGAFVTVRINQPLSSDHNHNGDTFSASLMQPLVADGVVIAQRGQTIYGRVAQAQKHSTNKPSLLRLELTSVTVADGSQIPVNSQLVTRQGGTTPAGVQAGTVGATTAVGAAIGGAAAWGTGAAIGAGAGAAAGIIGILVTRHHPTVVYPETALTFQLTSPVAVSTERAPQAFRFVGPEDYQQAPTFATRPGPRPAPYGYGPAYATPYAYPYPYYGYPYGWWGPSVGVYVGPGWGWGGWGWGRGGYRRWR